jgi:hypothetical protein
MAGANLCMIPLMDSNAVRESRVLWAFWLACALAATGAIAPLLLAGGTSSRIAGAVIPFGLAAVAMAVNAMTYHRGRPLASGLYFVAGLALVYGMLSMIAVPLRLAVIGTCPPAPALCQTGFEPPMTSGENSGLAFGIAMGTLAILVGFFGLLMLYRIRRQPAPSAPPVRRDSLATPVAAVAPLAKEKEPEPAATVPSATEPEPAAATPEPKGAAIPPPAPPKPRTRRAPKPVVVPPPEPLELTAPEEPLELAAPEERLELPAPSTPDAPSEDTPSSS